MTEHDNFTRKLSTLETLTIAYTPVHGVLSLVVCAFGIPMNVLNITILSRKSMRTPVNCILTWLAMFDLLTMVSYVPFSLHFYCLTWDMSPERNSLGWMTFLIFHVDFTATTHTISIWLGVTLAMFRYKHIFSPAKGYLTRVRRLIRARIAVFLVVIFSILVMIPNYLMNRLKAYAYFNYETNKTETIYITEPVNMETSEIKPPAQASLLLHGALAKFLPCILMVVYGRLLVKTLRTNIRLVSRDTLGRKNSDSFKTSTREPSLELDKENSGFHKKIEAEKFIHHEKAHVHCLNFNNQTSGDIRCSSNMSSFTTILPNSPSTNKNCSSSAKGTTNGGRPVRHQDNSRTTRMLLVVITLFLVTELPQSILIVLSATIPGFFMEVYVPLGDIMDMVALVNSGINFLLYCIMSRDFRTTLLGMMKSFFDRIAGISGCLTTLCQRSSKELQAHPEQSCTTLMVRSKRCTL